MSRTALRDVEAITVDLTFEARDGDRWRPIARRQLLVFEYKGGQIVRLVEYWEQ